MGSFGEAPKGNSKAGEKIFKTKCAQCHAVEKSGGHKQGISLFCELGWVVVNSSTDQWIRFIRFQTRCMRTLYVAYVYLITQLKVLQEHPPSKCRRSDSAPRTSA